MGMADSSKRPEDILPPEAKKRSLFRDPFILSIFAIAAVVLGIWYAHHIGLITNEAVEDAIDDVIPDANGEDKSSDGGASDNDDKNEAAAQNDETKLRILTMVDPKTYYDGVEGISGYEYVLTQAFAKSIEADAVYEVENSVPRMLARLKAGDADLIAAGLGESTLKAAKITAGPSYGSAKKVVSCKQFYHLPDDAAALDGMKVAATKGTAAATALADLVEKNPKIIEMQIADAPFLTLKTVHEGGAHCGVSDERDFRFAQLYFPDLRKAFDLSEEKSFAWGLAPGATHLKPKIESWLAKYKKSGELKAQEDKFFGYMAKFDYVDMRDFHRSIEHVLPRYEDMFKHASKETGLPWIFLASVSYQESHWNPHAVSPTGVLGMMMLTAPTAKSLGVTDRTNAEESIMGGARYLRKLEDRLPADVTGTDRLWITLAAYNMGYAHVEEAMKVAKERGLAPVEWADVRSVLPDVHGNSRQALAYVRNIRTYLNVLEEHEQKG